MAKKATKSIAKTSVKMPPKGKGPGIMVIIGIRKPPDKAEKKFPDNLFPPKGGKMTPKKGVKKRGGLSSG